MEVNVYKKDGSSAGTVQLDSAVFGIEPNDHAIWLDVRSLQANARQGTHKAKERGEVSGGGAKPWRQKGTGRARAGTSRSPVWVGGGKIFGPRPHTYSVGVNKKTKKLARCSAFTYKANADAVKVVEDFTVDAPRTRDFAAILDALELSGKKVLFLTTSYDDAVYRSGRNIAKVTMREARSASTFEVLDADVVLLQQGALNVLSAVLTGNAGVAAANETEAEVSE